MLVEVTLAMTESLQLSWRNQRVQRDILSKEGIKLASEVSVRNLAKKISWKFCCI